jgi:hypothetical protein
LQEDAVAEITDGWDESSQLTERQKAALAFTDAMLGNEPGGRAHLGLQFSAAEQDELVIGLGLFHGFSKVLIGLGLEPDIMSTTELPTPDTADVIADLNAGFASAEAAVERAVGEHRPVLDAMRSRVTELITGVSAGAADGTSGPEMQPWIDVAELFVIDIHALDDATFARAASTVDPSITAALFVGLALADAKERIARSVLI